MKSIDDERGRTETEFHCFMMRAILNCVRNAVRKVESAERRNRGISLSEVSDVTDLDGMAVVDRYPSDGEIRIELPGINVTVDSEALANCLMDLTEREMQSFVLHVGYGFSFREVGRILGITPERAKAYKYHGLKKAKENNRRMRKGGRHEKKKR